MRTTRTTQMEPEELHSNPAFTQGVIAPAGRMLYAARPGALVEIDAVAIIPE